MDKKLEKRIKEAFDAPEPLHRQEFLRGLRGEESTPTPVWKLMYSQFRYIPKWIWGLDMSVLIGTLLIMTRMSIANSQQDILGVISAGMPILAVTLITESGRSERYGMAELELATRFSLKSVVLARLGILGSWNLILFGIILAAGSRHTTYSFLRMGLYLLCPYLLTVLISLWIFKRIPVKEEGSLCAGVSVLVSAGVFFAASQVRWIFNDRYVISWTVVLLSLAVGTMLEGVQMVKRMEELEWSL